MKILKILPALLILLSFTAESAIAQQRQYYGYGNQVLNPNQMPYNAINPNQMPGSINTTNPGGYYYGQYPYRNQPGYGYYTANPYAPYYPALGAPIAANGGYFRFNVGGFSGTYWKSPSGYYYPWGAGAVYANPAPIIVVQQGESQVAQPAIGDLLKDMSSYLEEMNNKQKLKADDYNHLARRIRDIRSLDSTFRSRNNGILDANDEEKLRKDCAMLSGDISRRVLP